MIDFTKIPSSNRRYMKIRLLFVATPSLNCVFSTSAGITTVLCYQSSNLYTIGLVIYLR